MKILRIIGILAIVTSLVLGGTASVFAKNPHGESQGGGNNAHGKRGFVGTAVDADDSDGYVVTIETKQGRTIEVILTENTKYKSPRDTKGWITGIEDFLEILDEDIENIIGKKIGLLAEDVDEVATNQFTGDAVRLMLIPTGPPLHAHRVGIVTDFSLENGDGTIEIMDNHGVLHTFDVTGDTVYRPEGITSDNITPYESGDPETLCCVTVVTTGDPKNPDNDVAKAIVLHEDLPDWAGGKIIIRKIIAESDDPPPFEFDPSWSESNFFLSDDDWQYKSGWLEPDEYTVDEVNIPTGWELDGDPTIEDPDDESGSSGNRATIDLDLGETVIVTFTNTLTT